MDFLEEASDIEETPVLPEVISRFTSESQHVGLAFGLLRETSLWIVMFGCLMRSNRDGWTREEAILGGQLVRLAKSCRGILREASTHEHDLLFVLLRLGAEAVISFRYLLEFHSEELFESYLKFSLQHEKRLREDILENSKARGHTIAIEDRMLASIDRTFSRAGVQPDDMPIKRLKNWGGKSLYEKAKAIGLEEAYLGVIGGPSGSVHGSWSDLLRNHLEALDDTGLYAPNFEGFKPRPQPLLTLSSLSIDALLHYCEVLNDQRLGNVPDRLSALQERLRLADELHEEYLQRP